MLNVDKITIIHTILMTDKCLKNILKYYSKVRNDIRQSKHHCEVQKQKNPIFALGRFQEFGAQW